MLRLHLLGPYHGLPHPAGSFAIESVDRFAFYERSRRAAVYLVAAGEQQIYAVLTLKKGIVRPEKTEAFGLSNSRKSSTKDTLQGRILSTNKQRPSVF